MNSSTISLSQTKPDSFLVPLSINDCDLYPPATYRSLLLYSYTTCVRTPNPNICPPPFCNTEDMAKPIHPPLKRWRRDNCKTNGCALKTTTSYMHPFIDELWSCTTISLSTGLWVSVKQEHCASESHFELSPIVSFPFECTYFLFSIKHLIDVVSSLFFLFLGEIAQMRK